MIATQAAVVHENGGEFVIQDVTLDDPGFGEVLVRNIATGVCHSDMFVQGGMVDMPRVLGHEGAGVIEALGPGVNTLKVGDKVIMGFNSCGTCNNCLSGKPYSCESFLLLNMFGRRLDGSTNITAADGSAVSGNFFGQSSFARHSIANVRNVVKLPDSIPDKLHKIMGPFGCGILTGAGTVINALRVRPASSIVVFGGGGVGLAGAMAALASGATTVIVVDLNDDRLALAKTLGATHTFNGADANLKEKIIEATGGGAHYAMDTTGNMKVVRLSNDILRIGGTTALVGLSVPGTPVELDHMGMLDGRNIIGVVEGAAVPQVFIPELIDLYHAGKFPFDKMVKEYPFADINMAFHDSHVGTTVKGVVVF
ncbi:MAG: NAD(P)-dependent alcohol dehydrogenase [Aurantimicrobium sp.]|nr:NAD(P)-dependent alcohol dehydrogenase [Aurantimicrobium sp.]